MFRQVKAGKVRRGRDTILAGAAGLGTISPEVPRALVTQLDRLERQVTTGKLRVPPAAELA